MTDWTELGLALSTARRRKRMTQADVADRLGVHWQTVGEIERGHGESARAGVVVAFAALVGHPLAEALPVVEREHEQ